MIPESNTPNLLERIILKRLQYVYKLNAFVPNTRFVNSPYFRIHNHAVFSHYVSWVISLDEES
jgi:hypothetical protein